MAAPAQAAGGRKMRRYPKIAPYHCGPYRVAGILQDPGTIYGAGCNAVRTGEIGVLNGDPTANLLKIALEANGIPLAEYLPMNAVPWYDAPASRGAAILREGARFNRDLLLAHEVKLVLLMGTQAHRCERYLELPSDVVTRRLPHPGRLGLINFRVDGVRIGAERSREVLISGFRPVET
ncbi:hypothetical protein [Salipiger bermudensis]|uniref:hypothetical protein n=1 Tax=Salipiger bermudensis TaxID=344736 RepID=UPI001CD33A46|nr:hypothetical protein [Salipiger bermudensis]MCA0963474.1 hypothetical protein [Salipiger bermudensis]